MKKIILIFFLLLGFLSPVFAGYNWCADKPNPYLCNLNNSQDACACDIHPGLPGNQGSWSMRFFPIEKEKYECTFKMSPLGMLIDGVSLPIGVTSKFVGSTSGNVVKMDVDATNMKSSNNNEVAHIDVIFKFGAYDAPSVLSGFCVKK